MIPRTARVDDFHLIERPMRDHVLWHCVREEYFTAVEEADRTVHYHVALLVR